jgi:hypothetical protein
VTRIAIQRERRHGFLSLSVLTVFMDLFSGRGLLLDAYPLTLLLNGAITLRGGDCGRCVVSTCGFLWNVSVA